MDKGLSSIFTLFIIILLVTPSLVGAQNETDDQGPVPHEDFEEAEVDLMSLFQLIFQGVLERQVESKELILDQELERSVKFSRSLSGEMGEINQFSNSLYSLTNNCYDLAVAQNITVTNLKELDESGSDFDLYINANQSLIEMESKLGHISENLNTIEYLQATVSNGNQTVYQNFPVENTRKELTKIDQLITEYEEQLKTHKNQLEKELTKTTQNHKIELTNSQPTIGENTTIYGWINQKNNTENNISNGSKSEVRIVYGSDSYVLSVDSWFRKDLEIDSSEEQVIEVVVGDEVEELIVSPEKKDSRINVSSLREKNLNESINILGVLTSSEKPLTHQPIQTKISINGEEKNTTDVTDQFGRFNLTLNSPKEPSNYTIKINYKGNETHKEANKAFNISYTKISTILSFDKSNISVDPEQEQVNITGSLYTENYQPLPNKTITINYLNTSKNVTTDANGRFKTQLKSNQPYNITATYSKSNLHKQSKDQINLTIKQPEKPTTPPYLLLIAILAITLILITIYYLKKKKQSKTQEKQKNKNKKQEKKEKTQTQESEANEEQKEENLEQETGKKVDKIDKSGEDLTGLGFGSFSISSKTNKLIKNKDFGEAVIHEYNSFLKGISNAKGLDIDVDALTSREIRDKLMNYLPEESLNKVTKIFEEALYMEGEISEDVVEEFLDSVNDLYDGLVE